MNPPRLNLDETEFAWEERKKEAKRPMLNIAQDPHCRNYIAEVNEVHCAAQDKY